MKNILLIEPGYRNKYPPLALLKISTYHKRKGDRVVFVKGKDEKLRKEKWDIIYITTLFTFHWNIVIDTIKYYKRFCDPCTVIRIGGIMGSLMQNDIYKETGIKPHFGIWEKVDKLMPDYNLLKEYNHLPDWNASIGFMTRGCPNKCKFCAVNILEGNCDINKSYSLKNIVDETKKDLILLDNNVLASSNFNKIIDEIKKYGFYKGAKYNNRLRYVDFNQGVDARLLTEEKMRRLSEIAIKPLRIAFDNIKYKKIYIEKILLAKKYGIKHLSNFILFNFNDNPVDFYERLRINIELNKIHNLNIYSFPMKFVPLNSKNRKKNGIHSGWTKKELRGLQLILNATHGVVGPQMKFFDTAFGRNAKEFKKILNTRPESKILYRSKKWMSRVFKPQYLYIKEERD